MNFRWLLAASIAVALSFPIAASGQGQVTKIRASTIPSTDNGAFESARAKGFFAQQGLEVDTTPVAGGAFGIPALMAGQIQIASSNIVSIILAASQGLDIVIVGAGDATGANAPDLAGLVAKKGATIRSGKDLENKRIAVNARNNILWLYAREWVAKTGGDPDKVTFVEVPFPQIIDAVRNDRVDAAMLVEPFLSSSIKANILDAVAWPYHAVRSGIPVAQFVTTREYAQKNPQIIESFIRGHNLGVDWVAANKQSDEFFKIVSGYTKVSPESLRGTTIPVFVKTIDPAQLDFTIGLMKKHRLIKEARPGRELLHPKLLPAQ